MIEEAEAHLEIQMLGDFRITLNGTLMPLFPTRESELLFEYLLLHRERLFCRDALIANFFKDQPIATARKRLRNDIWRIRSVVEPDGIPAGTFLTATNREIGFNTSSNYCLDTEEFEREISKTIDQKGTPLHSDDSNRLRQALRLYRGDLLEGVYDDWCVWEKERLKMLYLRGLEILMNHHAAKSEWHRAIILGEQLISHDPLRENIHRKLIRFYYLVGDRPTAVLRYTEFAALLRRELDIEPMRSNTDLYSYIKQESMSGGENPAKVKRSDNKTIQECLGDIHLLANQLNDLSSILERRIEVTNNTR